MVIELNNHLIRNHLYYYYVGNKQIHYVFLYNYYFYINKIQFLLCIDENAKLIRLGAYDYGKRKKIKKEKYPDFYNYLKEYDNRIK